MLLFGKMTLEYAWGMRRRISPCSVILPSISYGRTRLPNWGFKTNASKLAGMIPTWLRLCLGKSFNAIALGHGLAHEVLFHSLEVSHRLCGIICLAAFDTCFSFDRHEQTITAHFEFCFNGGWFHLASSADYALHERFLLLKSGFHRLGSGWYVVGTFL